MEKGVYNLLGRDEKHGEILSYLKNCLKHRCGKKSDIFRTVYPNRNHVTTHPGIFIYNTHLTHSIVQEHSFNILCVVCVFKIAHLNLQCTINVQI